ncbi:MAG: hypothetical protein IAG13_29270 [Deltaproteobacteria bacterium]|nr:hypothetical protein [Nannocystaceae bacterium]
MAQDGDDSDALDRAAILARRQRFIALALTGLAASCGDDASTTSSPMPCLDAPVQTESETMTGTSEADATASGTTGMQQPCLGAMPETSSSDSTGVAESTTSTGTDTGATTDTGDGTGSSSGAPLPCLDVNPTSGSSG